MDVLSSVMVSLQEMADDSSTPKHIREKIVFTIKLLGQNVEKSIKVNKALNELEVLAEDANVQAGTRVQLFNIVSMLEVA